MSETGIDYLRVIAALEAKRARIDAAIAAIRELAGMAPVVMPAIGDQVADSSRQYAGMSVAVAAEAYLRSQGKQKSGAEIARALEHGGYKSETKGSFTNIVYSRLFKYVQDGKVFTKAGKGPHTRWGLKEWPPGRDDQLGFIPSSA